MTLREAIMLDLYGPTVWTDEDMDADEQALWPDCYGPDGNITLECWYCQTVHPCDC